LGILIAAGTWADIRVVPCDASVQSRKRGLCANALSAEDFKALAPGVSWYYNWGATPLPEPLGINLDFIPMAWNNEANFQDSIKAYLAAGHRPRRIFANNEPNLKGQAFLTPEQSAQLLQRIRGIAAPYGIPVVSPHMAIGTATPDSITAYDPLQLKTVTYTFFEPFLDALIQYAGAPNVSETSAHSYGNSGEMTWLTNQMHSRYNRPMWITEFCEAGAKTDEEEIAYMMSCVDYLESTPWVEGYAWFKERKCFNPHGNIFAERPGALTALGAAYVAMPVHDPELYYKIPGTLQGVRYVTASGASIAPTTDASGFADMVASQPDAALSYNIQNSVAKILDVAVRVGGRAGSLDLWDGPHIIGSAKTHGGWETVTIRVKMLDGPRNLKVVLGSAAQRLASIKFD
jgi:hypothetical protein